MMLATIDQFPSQLAQVRFKILERTAHNHVYCFLMDNDFLNPHQSGFRPHHSTETCLTDMVDNWLSNMNDGKLTGVTFIDLRKAFDTVYGRVGWLDSFGILEDRNEFVGGEERTT